MIEILVVIAIIIIIYIIYKKYSTEGFSDFETFWYYPEYPNCMEFANGEVSCYSPFAKNIKKPPFNRVYWSPYRYWHYI